MQLYTCETTGTTGSEKLQTEQNKLKCNQIINEKELIYRIIYKIQTTVSVST